ncbi:ABC transporter ATP-binding protein [Gemella cuniculi]|uniref:ABC transporter ATP-binding protein n=1 Tax=Gemella cuniculi TaxID=150240 RepID=UPI00042466F0|nr:ABC transporter ATP-binding protein [Gemella cuniculi]
MVLEFKNYKKKIRKDTTLELDFEVKEGEILAILSNDKEGLEIIKESFRNRTKYKGQILFDSKNLSKEKLIFSNDYGFYNHLSLIKNLQKFLSMFKINMNFEDLKSNLLALELESDKKYKKLLKNEKIKFHTLFSILTKQKLVVVDNADKSLTSKDKLLIKELLSKKEQHSTVIVFDNMLNEFNDIANNVLVISDGIKSYYGTLSDLLIIKQLAALSLSHQDDLDIILQDYQYTVYNDREIVVRDEVLEEVVYELLKNDIEVYQIRNLGEKIKLYAGDGEK